MTYNELMMLLEHLQPEKIRIEVEKERFFDIEKADFQKMMGRRCMETSKAID